VKDLTMRTRISPLMALTLLLMVALPLVSCSDGAGGNGGVTGPAPTPAIAIALGASTLSVTPGNDNTLTVNVTRSGGFTGVVNLTLEGAPAGVAGTFSPAAVPADASSSTLTISASGSAAPGSHGLTVRATGSGVTAQTASLSLTVEVAPSIAVAIDPDALQIDQGASGQVAVTLDRTNFTGNVALALEGAPSGVTGTFDPAVLSGEAAASTLTIEVGEDADVGEHELTLRASGEGVGDATTAVALMVAEMPAIAISVEPAELGVNQGTSGDIMVTVVRTNFTGDVDLALDGAPSGVTGTFDPVVLSGEAAASTLTITVGEDAEPGEYELTVRASGDGVEEESVELPLTIRPVTEWQQISSGFVHTCAITTSGDAYCWGRNHRGQLGDGNPTNAPQPVPVRVAGGHTWGMISAGGDFTCGLTVEGDAYCWGAGSGGRLGNGTNDDISTPEPVSGGLTITLVSAGGTHACGITSEGPAYCWGDNGFGKLGSPGFSSPVPREVTGGYTFGAISAGGNFTCAVTPEGAAYCWGSNLGTPGNSVEPVEVTGDHTFAFISSGSGHVCGLTGDNVALCWGNGSDGQLGTGSAGFSAEPAEVAGGHTFAAVVGGSRHTCGVTAMGSAYCWGRGNNGELGNGSTSHSGTPVPVSGELTFARISAGSGFSCAVTTSGSAYCWGSNVYQGLSSPVPVRVPEPQ
jgi:alpha-tubulin suppressor-like RCC1 family protein/uncharacterized membrane protein